MGFKEDEDFVRFLTMGAYGTAEISADLERSHGHQIVELERYARGNKVWAIKVALHTWGGGTGSPPPMRSMRNR